MSQGRFGIVPRIDEQYGFINTPFIQQNPYEIPLAGRFGLFAQAPQQLTPVQAAAKNFGDLPLIGPMINTIKDYEDRINYRNADPETRRLLGLE